MASDTSSDARALDAQLRRALDVLRAARARIEALEQQGVEPIALVGLAPVDGSTEDDLLTGAAAALASAGGAPLGQDDVAVFAVASRDGPQAANRISARLGSRGPSVTIAENPAASWIALHLACQSLRARDSATAMVADAHGVLVLTLQSTAERDGRSARAVVRATGLGFRHDDLRANVLARTSVAASGLAVVTSPSVVASLHEMTSARPPPGRGGDAIAVECGAEAVAIVSAPPVAEAGRSPALDGGPIALTLRRGATTPALFCVHAILPGAFPYWRLANALGDDRSVIAIAGPAEDATGRPLARIEEIAARYVLALRELDPRGPYLLCGLSFGGAVAYEMAQQLTRQGRRVPLVVLCDVLPVEQPDVDRRLTATADEDVGRLLAAIGWADTPAQRQRLREVVGAHLRAARAYAPQPYAGRVLYLRARERSAMAPSDPRFGWTQLLSDGPLPAEPEALWARLATGRFEARVVPGWHFTMLDTPELAADLRNAIRAALDADNERS